MFQVDRQSRLAAVLIFATKGGLVVMLGFGAGILTKYCLLV